MAKAKRSKQNVCETIRELVEAINGWNGSSGDAEKFWRENQQHLLQILAENPLELYPLDPKLKEDVKNIVSGYLDWSFNGYF